MFKTISYDEAFKDYNKKTKEYNAIFPAKLLGQKIIDFCYGPDADGDPHLYYLTLKNGIKIGMARVFEDGKVKELDRTERYKDGSIIRFQFHNWPK